MGKGCCPNQVPNSNLLILSPKPEKPLPISSPFIYYTFPNKDHMGWVSTLAHQKHWRTPGVFQCSHYEHSFTLSKLQCFEALVKCVWPSNRCSWRVHEASQSFVDTLQSHIKKPVLQKIFSEAAKWHAKAISFKSRIPGSRQSMRGYILTNSMI